MQAIVNLAEAVRHAVLLEDRNPSEQALAPRATQDLLQPRVV